MRIGIDIKELVELQEKLDNVVYKNHNIKNMKDVFEQRKLALAVEIAELVNEVKCFKFWSFKRGDNKEKIGDEFADVLHFALSCAIYLKSKKCKFVFSDNEYNDKELSIKFLELLNLASNLKTAKDCGVFLEKLFGITKSLKISVNEIFEFYKKKNLVNLERQKNNY